MSQRTLLCHNRRPSTSDWPLFRQHMGWQSNTHSFKSGPQKLVRRQRTEHSLRALDTGTVSRSDGMDLEVEESRTSTSTQREGTIAVFKASRSATQPVTPGMRPLGA